MAFTNQQIIDYLLANPELTDPQIVDAMKQFKITPAQMASAVGLSEGAILSRIAKTIPYGSSLILGDTIIVPEYRVIGSGEDQQIGGLETFYTSKTTGDVNYKAPAGSEYQQYAADGTFQRTGKTQKEQSFFGGLVEAFKDPVVLAALGGAAAGGLFGGAGALGSGAAATVGSTGLTVAELAQLDLALGGVGGTTGATSLAGGLTTGATIPTLTNLTGGSGATTGLLTNTAGSTLANTAGSTVANTAGSTVANTAGSTLANTAGTTLANTAATTLTATELANAAKLGLTAAQYAQLFSSTAQTASGLLQQQTSKEAADKARAMIDTETAAAKAAAQFRPIGMTTRFGSSQFVVDPVTGRLTSAGYTLSPEAKAAQDRFVKLAETGIQQAEGAQQAFKPLQTGAESLFKLGAGYLAEKPEDVAKNYLASQMALLKPGRELELANLQNRLQQQGRGGLSVAQGGTLGATTPELQALFNARAQQEAQLAANAQQYGQQNVLFGAGLLGQGSQAMGQYYGGQQAAYAPYTTALGQVQNLETAAQQPFQLGVGLGKETSTAGYNVGRLGLTGAGQSVALATGADATRNPYATAIGGLAANPALGQYVGGLFSGVPPVTAMSAPATTFGTGNYYGSQDLGLYL
jgi:hypothetical protein